MEVDLLCADSRVVVEIDGAQHLADPVAYRRDRRKDQLLQENGYLVLRFLAEDLAKELDSVLDGILRSLSARRRPATTTHALIVMQRSRTCGSEWPLRSALGSSLWSSDAHFPVGRNDEASRPIGDRLRLEHGGHALEQSVAARPRQAHQKKAGMSTRRVPSHVRKNRDPG
jgi:uncharacterized protein DUF559